MAQNLEIGKVIVKEEAVLEKFEGEVEDGIIVERIHLTDGVRTRHEFLEDGEVVRTDLYKDGQLIEGGEDNSTN